MARVEGTQFFSIKRWGEFIIHDSLVLVDAKALGIVGNVSDKIVLSGRKSLVQIVDPCRLLVKSVDDEKEEVLYGIYNYKDDSFLRLGFRNPRFVTAKSVICISILELICYSLTDGQELWRVDFSGKGQWQDEQGVWHAGGITRIEEHSGVAVVLLGNDVLVGLDVLSGAVKWERAMPNRMLTPAAFAEGKIYWLALGLQPIYLVVDMVSGAILAEQVPGEALLGRRVFVQPTLHREWLLLTSVNTHEILAVNKFTLAVEDVTKIESCQNRIPIDNAPQVHGNRLYQLDGDGTLHIFEEKE